MLVLLVSPASFASLHPPQAALRLRSLKREAFRKAPSARELSPQRLKE
jgi:hypothetical protein